jgi:hypothetical protein
MNTPPTPVLKRLLAPVGKCLTVKTARALVKLRADPEVQLRMEELGRKSNEGKLGLEEHAEYEAYVMAGNLIAILQSQARRRLAEAGKST